ncbi:MAG: dihydropyrimidinase [Anaerolineaceae bacterium]|jgi:dihydropyrimidinase
MKKLIRNGTIVTPQKTFTADLLIEGERIALVGQALSVEADEIWDAEGLLVLPGGVDVHVHLDLPMFDTVSSDDHYTGTKAAAFGGTTTVIDFVSQNPGTLVDNIAAWRAKADPKVAVDYGFHMNITRFDEQVAEEIPSLPAHGITSLKVFTAYNNRLRLADGDIFKVMRIAGKAGILTMVHAENGDIIDILIEEALAANKLSPIWHARTRPGWGEVESSLRAIAMAAQAQASVYLVHMNMAGEVDQLAYGRSQGVAVMGETCPQYLSFTEKEMERADGAKWVCSPPMRGEDDRKRLWKGLLDQTIQTLATDHCPFFYDGTTPIKYEGQPVAIPGKELGKDNFTLIPNGLPGVGDRLPVFWTSAVSSGKMTPSQFVELTASNPAKIFGLYPQKGCLEPGSDADLVLWDPLKEVQYGVAYARHRTDYNLYEGWKLQGFPKVVFSRGNLLVRDGEWHGKPGQGKYLYRKQGEIL